MIALRPAALAALLATALLAAGCKKAPEPPPENVVVEQPAPPAPVPEATPEPEPKPVVNEAALIPSDEPSADEQMREDAEATGMTSRVRPIEAPSDSAAAGNVQQ